MQLIRDLERLLFCDGRLKSLITCINGLLGWFIDRLYHTPRIAIGACLAIYFVHGFVVNAVASQQGQHPALLLNTSARVASQTVNEPSHQTREQDLARLMSGKMKQEETIADKSATTSKEKINFREFQTAVLSLSRASNFEDMTPEQTAAITRAALSLQK